MIWKLESETETERTYIQEKTGSKCQTELIFVDELGGKWWGFKDLFSIPYIRTLYAQKITMLFTVGLTIEDLRTWISEEKALLKSNDPEKYEKLYSKVLDKESLIESTADPMKQHLSLATLYVLADNERVDYFDMSIAEQKLQQWSLDNEAAAFFLSWHIQRIEFYYKTFSNIGLTASTNPLNKK